MKTEDIKLFHIIVDSGSLVRAADLLSLPKSNLSRRLKGLEEEINAHLFHRSSRTLTLTEKGQLFYQETKSMVADWDNLLQRLDSNAFELTGHLRIQVLPLPEIVHLLDGIHEFMALNPKVTVEVITHAQETNLIENHIDVAFRVGDQLEDSSLIARPLKQVDFGCYASPCYLNQHPTPKRISDLEAHRFIQWRQPNGKLIKDVFQEGFTQNTKSRLTVNHPEHLLHAGLKGAGLFFYPRHIGNQLVKQGLLVALLPELTPMKSTGWLVYPNKKALSNAAAQFIDFITKEAELINFDTVLSPYSGLTQIIDSN